MAEDHKSECHSSSISPVRGKEGEFKCDVCGNPVSDTGVRLNSTAPEAAAEEGKTKPATVTESIAKDTVADEQEKGAEGTAAEGGNTANSSEGNGESGVAAAEGSQEGAGAAAEGSGEANQGGTA